jgi:Initiator Replication protein
MDITPTTYKKEPEELVKFINKPSVIISSEGKLGLIQRKCWNILALHAIQSGLKTGQRRFQVPVTFLTNELGYTTKNYKHFTDLLENIARINISGDMFREDGSKFWISFNMFGQCIVENGICDFEYPSFVAEAIANPKRYIKLLLRVQNCFQSSYGLGLYEFLKTRYIEKKKKGYSEMTVNEFRSLMGLENGKYKEFKQLKKNVINTAIKEINEKTDLFVTIELEKMSRKVVKIRFQITENPKKIANLKRINAWKDLQEVERLDKGLVEKLKEIDFSETQGLELVGKYGVDTVETGLDVVLSTPNVKDKTAMLFDYFNNPAKYDLFRVEQKRKAEEEQAEARRAEEAKLHQDALQAAQLAEQRTRQFKALQAWISEHPEDYTTSIDQFLQQERIFATMVQGKAKDTGKTIFEIVKDDPMIQGGFKVFLGKKLFKDEYIF